MNGTGDANAFPYEGCSFDRDCGPGKLCFVNVSWTPDGFPPGGFCSCNAFYGWRWVDESCNGFSSTTYLLVFLLVIQLMAGVGLSVIACKDMLFSLRFLPLRLNASTITLYSVTTVLLCFCVWRFFLMLSFLSPAENNTFLSDSENAEKYTTYSVKQRPFAFVVQVFLVIACLNVSVMWVEVAYRAKKMKTRMIQSVTHYRKVVLAVEGIFALAMGILAAIGRQDFAPVVAMPVLFILLVTFSVGRYRMMQVLQTALSLEESSNERLGRSPRGLREKTSAEKTRRTMLAIQRVSLHVAVGIIGVVGGGIGYFLFNNRNNFVHGAFSVVALFEQVIAISILYIVAAVFFYSHRSINKLIRRERGVPDVSTGLDASRDESNTRTGTQNHLYPVPDHEPPAPPPSFGNAPLAPVRQVTRFSSYSRRPRSSRPSNRIPSDDPDSLEI